MKKRTAILWIFLCCWLTYLTAYLCRVNFSSVMEAISLERGFTSEHLGIIGAVFYGVYACGQLVNGYIGDRVRPNIYIIVALCGTLLCNLGMAVVPSFAGMLVIWGINGCFQSMFWSTIIRVLAQNIPPEKRALYSMGISLAMPAAYIVSWSVLGGCLDGAAVRWYFLVPVFAAAAMIGAWLLLSRNLANGVSQDRRNKAGLAETVHFICGEKLHWMLLVCMCHGLIKEGAAYWLPLLLTQTTGLGNVSPFLLAAVLPVANALGIMGSRVLMQRGASNPYRILIAVFGGIALLCAGLLLRSQGFFLIGLIAAVSGLCYGSNTILMSFIPMQYTEKNMVASIIGVFDFASYVGAAISTYVLGKVLASAGFGPLPGIWLFAALCGIVLSAVVVRKRKALA